jgi:lipopolysaccharide export system permease protein
MTVHREVVAAKACGLSFHRLIAPMVLVGALLAVAALALTDVVPRANRVAGRILQADSPGRTWRSDFVYRSEDGLTWQVSRLTAADGRMTDVVLERPPTESRAGLHVLASAAGWTPGEGWLLVEGYLRSLRPDSTEHTIEFERMLMPQIAEKPDELLEVPPAPEEMTYAEVNRLAEILQRTGGDARELLVKREQKLSIPISTLIILLFGAPLATTSKRGGAAFGIGLSLATVITYIMLFRVTAAMGEAGALQPLTAAWLPNALFLGAAVVALVRVRT